MQREFYSILKELNAEGSTIFLSSHILSEIQKYCKRAAIIRQGKLLISDDVENLVHTNAKKVTLSGISELPEIKGITGIEKDGEAIRFIYSGNPSLLLTALSPLPITDISIQEPDLEEVFTRYYTED